MYKPVAGSISRRALFRAGISSFVGLGVMAFLPRSEGGYLLPCAYADELGSTEVEDTYTFTVVGLDQVGIRVVDVSRQAISDDGEPYFLPVQGAKITATAVTYLDEKHEENTRTATVTSDATDAKGQTLLSIKTLRAQNEDGSVIDESYTCVAELSLKTEDNAPIKMRDFSTGKVRLKGGGLLVLGAHQYTQDEIYLERFTFNDCDVHYTSTSFARSKANNADHTFLARIKGVTKDSQITIEAFEKKEDGSKGKVLISSRSAMASYDASKGWAKATFTGKFLEIDGKDKECLDADDCIIAVSFEGITSDIEMHTQLAPLDSVSYISPLQVLPATSSDMFSFSATWDWPVFNSVKFQFLVPALPLVLYLSPTYFVFGFGLDSLLFGPNESGNYGIMPWGVPIESTYEHFSNTYDTLNEKIHHKMWGNSQPFLDSNSNATHFTTAKSFNVSLIVQFVANIQWMGFTDPEGSLEVKKTFAGGYTLYAGLSASANFTVQFLLFEVIPMYFTLSASVSFIYSFTAEWTDELYATETDLDCNTLITKNDREEAINLTISFGVGIGVGVASVKSVGISATVVFAFTWTWPVSKELGEKPTPHALQAVTFTLELIIHFWLFKTSVRIWGTQKQWDNWKDNQLSAEEDSLEDRSLFRFVHPDGTLRHTIDMTRDGLLLAGSSSLSDSLIPITNDELIHSREAEASLKLANDIELPSIAGRKLHVDKEPRIVVGEDGTISVELVEAKGFNTFTFGGLEPAEGQTKTDVQEAEIPEAEVAEAEVQEADGTQELGATGDAEFLGQSEGIPSVEEALTADGEQPSENLSTSEETSSIASQTSEGDQPTQATEGLQVEAVLTAQDASDAYPLAFPDDYLAFMADNDLSLMDEEGYSYTYDPSKTTGAVCDVGGINGIADSGGICPSVDVIIYKDVFADARQRIVVMGDTVYSFRIGGVNYPTGERTRVMASRFDMQSRTWQTPTVIEYGSGVRGLHRTEMFDYDFDVITRPSDTSWAQGSRACLVVTGGMRPSDDLGDVLGSQTIAVVLIDEWLDVKLKSVQRVKTFLGDQVPADKQYMIDTPIIIDRFAPADASGVFGIVLPMRSSQDAGDLLSQDAQPMFALGQCFVRDETVSLSFTFNASTMLLNGEVSDTKLVCGGSTSGDGVLRMVFMHHTGYEGWSAVIPAGKGFSDVVITKNLESTDSLSCLQPWAHRGEFLFTYPRPDGVEAKDIDYHLYAGTFDAGPGATGKTGLTSRKVDSSGIKTAAFCVNGSGDFLFYYDTTRQDAESAANGAADINRIMASRLIDGKFTEDYVFANMDHDILNFQLMTSGRSDASAFVTFQLEYPNTSKGHLRYMAVPYSLAATVDAVSATDYFLYAGKKNDFQVDFTNHGNVIIGGFDLEMYDHANDELAATAHIDFTETSNILLTSSSHRWVESVATAPGDGENGIWLSAASENDGDDDAAQSHLSLSNEEKKGWFMPTKKLSCRVGFDIPSDWTGEKTIYLKIVNAWTPGINGIDDPVELMQHFYHESVAHSGTFMMADEQSVSSTFYDPVERLEGDSGGSGGDSGGSSGGTHQKLPDTGDSLTPLTPLALAVGGVGSALAAYSARRTEIEREER